MVVVQEHGGVKVEGWAASVGPSASSREVDSLIGDVVIIIYFISMQFITL